MQLNSTNYDVGHYTTAYSALLHEVNFFNENPHVSWVDRGAVLLNLTPTLDIHISILSY
jgi:hypothetical protein